MPTPSTRFADKANLKALFAGLKAKYEPKDTTIVRDASYVHTDSNYTAAEKQKLAGIEDGAQANVINGVKLGGTALSPSSGAVNIPMDTSLSPTSTNPVQNCIVSRPILSLMGRVGALPDVVPEGWSELASKIAAGEGESVMPVGTQVGVKWTVTNGSTVYDAYWNVAHHGTVTIEGGQEKPAAFLHMDRCLPFDTQFSPYQAFLCAVDGLPAGTYNIAMGVSWGTHCVSGKTHQFTLANALPAGGQLAGFYGAPDQNPSNWRVYAFSSATATSATETCVVTEGDGGTNLGTFTFAGYAEVPASGTPETTASVTVGDSTYRYYGINSLQRVAYGNNRWLHSPLRQYLNATGNNWWQPATVFDRPPAYASHKGFLTGLDADFVSAMVPLRTVTLLNRASDGGTASDAEFDVTYDKVFLPSSREHYGAPNADMGGTHGSEGELWDYWKRVAGTASPLGWWAYHPEYIQYDLASPTTPRSVWLRSAYRGSAYSVGSVYAHGYCTGSSAILGLRAAPACAIG